MNESLCILRLELFEKHRETGTVTSRYGNGHANALVSKIEHVIADVIKTVAGNGTPTFQFSQFRRLYNRSRRGQSQESTECMQRRVVRFARKNGGSKFAIIVFLLSKIYKLLSSSRTTTKRELYYGNLDLFNSQVEVDIGIRDVCFVLESPPWELGIFATATGIIAGPLMFKSSDGVITSCDTPGGILIPPNIMDVELISTSIQWALVVEKDAAFQKILDENALEKMRNCLFLTGKGYPDINMRLLICRLWESFKIPILVLVDADPHGLEIMCTYRYGSSTLCVFSERLACPSVRWLGVHPSDVNALAVESTELSERDVRKLSLLVERPYIKQNKSIMREIETMLMGKVKAEIEGIANVSPSYMTNVYIPSKIRCREFY